jgi:hypothetical protein
VPAPSFPAESHLKPQLAEAYYHDTYEAPLRRTDLKPHEIYVAILGHLPWWARALIIVRNTIVAPLGLHAETAARVWTPERKDNYVPGDKIVRFTLFSQDENEIIAGLDDKHLDFRVSVMKHRDGAAHRVSMSTVIFVHGAFGKAYLSAILPFHRFGMKHLLAQAVAQHRI